MKKLPRKPKKGKSLAEVNSKLAKQWHPTKNDDLTPYDVGSGFGKVWWKCYDGKWPDGSFADDHEFEASVSNRIGNSGNCSVCTGKVVVPSASLKAVDPLLSKQWHPKNKKSPDEIFAHSGNNYWWKCHDGRWPDGSFADDHEWEAPPDRRVGQNSGCPFCDGHRVCPSNSLKVNHPELMKEWHPTKNSEKSPDNLLPGHNGKVWWKCHDGKWPDGSFADDHEWDASVASRALSNVACPCCRGLKAVDSNCLSTTHPELAKQWHPKNEKLPDDVTKGSNKKVWWKCYDGNWPDGSSANDHEWKARISDRVSKNQGCSCCYSRTIVPSNCLNATNPNLAKQWHPTKNDDLKPSDFSEGSNEKVWWKCLKGPDHEWLAVINSRNRGNGCPWCDLTPQSKQELTITFELSQFFDDIDPKGFKTRVGGDDGEIKSIDIYIPQLNLGIEFDGSYWHKDKHALDKLKTKKLQNEGFLIFRIREEGEEEVTENDVFSKTPYNGKEIANNVLKQIMKMYDLDTKKIAKIESYIVKKELQNEESLLRYIDMILTEKAEKKLTSQNKI
jgi:hypothetical protein